jgi:hypothetical protein
MSDPLDIFGSTDPRMMPGHLFGGAIHLDYGTAIRGDPRKQNYSVCPRHWYIDADFNCARCRKEFTWTANEQKAWFEKYNFWIDSHPRLCKMCMADRKHLEALRLEYDSTVAAARPRDAIGQKRRIVEVVRELEAAFGRLHAKMIETKELFERQIQKAQPGCCEVGAMAETSAVPRVEQARSDG